MKRKEYSLYVARLVIVDHDDYLQFRGMNYDDDDDDFDSITGE